CHGSDLSCSLIFTPSSENLFLFLLQCHTNYIPVCGSNGDTYQNECFLRRAACKHQKEITVVARGPCYSGMCDILLKKC
uniref:Kazal-like domain-containing protein n=1 Tax=Sus scrofa TaxID=9823 RepID=A0A8D0S9I8_PIG